MSLPVRNWRRTWRLINEADSSASCSSRLSAHPVDQGRAEVGGHKLSQLVALQGGAVVEPLVHQLVESHVVGLVLRRSGAVEDQGELVRTHSQAAGRAEIGVAVV
jgi:hypothetical protein